MTFQEILDMVLIDLDMKPGDKEVNKVKSFVNRGYYELLKREKTDIPESWELVNPTDELLTNEKNKEFISSFAKCLYFLYDDDYAKSELHKRDYENMKIFKTKRITHISYDR